jgi:hypothetical protein
VVDVITHDLLGKHQDHFQYLPLGIAGIKEALYRIRADFATLTDDRKSEGAQGL